MVEGLIIVGIWGLLGGFDWIFDSYNCVYSNVSINDVDIYNIENILQNTQYVIDYSTYETWKITKLEAALQLNLSNETYLIEKNMVNNLITTNNLDIMNFNKKNVGINDVNLKEAVTNFKEEIFKEIDIKVKVDVKKKKDSSSDLDDDLSDLL